MKRYLALCAGLLATISHVAVAAEAATEPLGAYENVSKALVGDDLAAAQKAAAELAAKAEADSALKKHAEALSKSTSLEAARDHFKDVSKEAIPFAKGKPGYFVMTCPMVKNGEWVQKGEQVANPYMGKKMPACGAIKKEKPVQK